MTFLSQESTATSDVERGPVSARPVTVASNAGTFRHVLVATDGSPVNDGAVRLADLIAGREQAPVEVISVLGAKTPAGERSGDEALPTPGEQLVARIRAQVSDVIGARSAWRIAIDTGPVVETICRTADARRSELIVVGFGRHRRLRDRSPDKATVRGIVEQSCMPVLVVPPDAGVLPARAMLAVDFGRSSIQAARAALRVIGAPGVMHLVHVHTSHDPVPGWPADGDPGSVAGPFFDALELELCPPPGVSFERVVLVGDEPVLDLLAYASTNEIDLIAVGHRGRTPREASRLGGVPTGILRSAQCAVLVAGCDHGAADETG